MSHGIHRDYRHGSPSHFPSISLHSYSVYKSRSGERVNVSFHAFERGRITGSCPSLRRGNLYYSGEPLCLVIRQTPHCDSTRSSGHLCWLQDLCQALEYRCFRARNTTCRDSFYSRQIKQPVSPPPSLFYIRCEQRPIQSTLPRS